MLLQAGLIVNRIDYRFDITYEKVRKFVKKNGRIPSAHSDDKTEVLLGKWRLYHVSRMREGKLEEEKSGKLNALGLALRINDVGWGKNFSRLTGILRKKSRPETSMGKMGLSNR